MRSDLETLYEQELYAIRHLALEFAQKRPKIAGRLLIEPETGISGDPHVERLIEAFAFLTARIRLKLDDEFPELTDSLLEMLYPQYLAPVPSATVAQFEVDPSQGVLRQGHRIPRHAGLYSRELQGVRCRFRTTADCVVWPLELETVEWRTAPFGDDIQLPGGLPRVEAVVRVVVRARGVALEELSINQLRFFLGSDERTGYQLYERLHRDLTAVVVSCQTAAGTRRKTVLPSNSIRPVGFEPDEALLSFDSRVFPGYGLLLEYFAFPQKFLFSDLVNLPVGDAAPVGERFELWFCLPKPDLQLQQRVQRESLKLGCVPLINLFNQSCDPIRLDQMRASYKLVPDAKMMHGFEVISVDKVFSTKVASSESREYFPFFSSCHGTTAPTTYWHADRRASLRPKDKGSDVWMSFVDLKFDPHLPPTELIHVTATCSNRSLPIELRDEGPSAWELMLEGVGPLKRVRAVIPPTEPARPTLDQSHWRVISHLSLNHLPITDGANGAHALREILRLYDHVRTPVTAQHIDGLLSANYRRKTSRIAGGPSSGFARGVEITLTFDPEKYAGAGLYLFASVLDRFLGEFVSLNSFVQTVCRVTNQHQPFLSGPCRAGHRLIL